MRNLVPRLNRDAKLVLAASSVRSVGYGFLSVFFGVYLNLLGMSLVQAGVVFSAIMAGGALSNILVSWKGDALGRRRMLVAMCILMALGGVLFPFASSMAVLAFIGLFAMTTATGGDRTAFLSLDMAILAEAAEPSRRTALFSWYSLIGLLGKALGALLVAAPAVLQRAGLAELTSFKAMFGIYCLTALGGLLFYARLSPEAEATGPRTATSRQLSGSARGTTLKLAGLFSLDALGGGFAVQSFVSFWFVSRFGADPSLIAVLFAGGQLLNAGSVLLATPVAHRIGLINTMASTQVVSNLLLVGMALSGDLWLAVTFYLARELANDMDIPTRQSYTMALVPREARTATAGVTNLGRNLSQAATPGIAGLVAQSFFLAAPFLICSGIKLVYNGALYLAFRSVKPPEEIAEAETGRKTSG